MCMYVCGLYVCVGGGGGRRQGSRDSTCAEDEVLREGSFASLAPSAVRVARKKEKKPQRCLRG